MTCMFKARLYQAERLLSKLEKIGDDPLAQVETTGFASEKQSCDSENLPRQLLFFLGRKLRVKGLGLLLVYKVSLRVLVGAGNTL